MEKTGKKLDCIKAILTSAEMLLPPEREIIEKVFGAPLYDYYGNRETNVIAAQCEIRKGYHVSIDTGLIEVVDKNGRRVSEGETGEIVITDFHNHVMPLIRYRIGDVGVATYEKCPCGRNLPIVKNFSGRKLELIKAKSGDMVPGEFFLLLLDRYKWIERAQVIQENEDKIILGVAMKYNPENLETETAKLKEDISNYLGELDIDIQFKTFESLLKSGKHRWVISKIQGKDSGKK